MLRWSPMAEPFIRLKPADPKPPNPQCDWEHDQEVYATHYLRYRAEKLRRLGKDPAKCRNSSSYRIGSKHFCSQHGGKYLLHLVEEGTITLEGDLP